MRTRNGVIDMTFLLNSPLIADLAARVERKRAVTRLEIRLAATSDRRLEDMGIARGDIADVAEAAYPRRHASAASDPTFRSRVALATLRSH